MSTQLLEIPCQPDVPRFEVATVYERPVRGHLPPHLGRIIRMLRSEQADLLRPLMGAASVGQFREMRKQVAQPYHDLRTAITKVLRAIRLTNLDLVRLAQRGVSSLVGEFTSAGAKEIGTALTEEILFSLQTLRRTNNLLELVIKNPPPVELVDQDRQLAAQFGSYAFWADLHLHLLWLLRSVGASLKPEILDEVVEGLRAGVMAAATVRQAVRLRGLAGHDHLAFASEWDDEDQDLASASDGDVGSTLPDAG